MDLINIGKKLLNEVNRVEKTNLTPSQFFYDVYYPIMLGGKTELIYVNNSPFNNNAHKNKSKEAKLGIFKEKIKSKHNDACILVGGYGTGYNCTTSYCRAMHYNDEFNENDIYYSWIGYCCGVRLSGLVDIYFNSSKILYDIYLGWKEFNNIVNSSFDVENNKKFNWKCVSVWNSQWLNYYYDDFKQPKLDIFTEKYIKSNNGKLSLKPVNWVRTIFSLSKKYPNKELIGFPKLLSKTDETYGAVIIQTKQISSFMKFCKEYLSDSSFLTKPSLFEKLYDIKGLMRFLNLGSIGITQLKPDLLRLELKESVNQSKYNNFLIDNDIINYYKLYYMTIIGNKNIETDVQKHAELLAQFSKTSTNKNKKKLIDDLLNCRTERNVIDAITKLVEFCVNSSLTDFIDEFDDLYKFLNENHKNLIIVIKFIKLKYIINLNK